MAEAVQLVALSTMREAEDAPDGEPFDWQRRLYALPAIISGWLDVMSNRTAQAWDRTPNAPRWFANHGAADREGVDLANEAQPERNTALTVR